MRGCGHATKPEILSLPTLSRDTCFLLFNLLYYSVNKIHGTRLLKESANELVQFGISKT